MATIAAQARRSAPAEATPDERAKLGKEARSDVSRSTHGDWAPAADRPDPVDVLEGQAKTRVPRAGPPAIRAHAGLPVHVLPRGGRDHGRRSRGHPDLGPLGPALRRRAPLQLRGLRRAGSPARPRRQRLRRDAAGALGVGRQAPGGEPRDRRPRPRSQRRRAGGRRARGDRGVPPADARPGRAQQPRRLVPAARSQPPDGSVQRRADKEATQDARPRRRQGGVQEPDAGALEARPTRRRRAPVHQRPAADRADRGCRRERGGGVRRARAEGRDRHLPADARDGAPAPLRLLPLCPHRAQGRRRRQRRHPRVGRALRRARRAGSRSSCRSRRPRSRCWRRTRHRAPSPSTAGGWSRGSG